MTVSNSVFEDLYELYQAGEASADSRALVEEYLRANPAAAPAPHPAEESVKLPPVEPPADLEVRSLKRTARLLNLRSVWGAIALSLSFLPATLGYREDGVNHWLFIDRPWAAIALYCVALAAWIRFFLICRGLLAAGLQPLMSRAARVAWSIAGMTIGTGVVLPIQSWTGHPRNAGVMYFIGACLGYLAGQLFHQIPQPEDLNRPTTIFTAKDDDSGK